MYAGLALVAVSIGLYLAGVGSVFNVTKLLALTTLGFALLLYLDPPLSWLVVLASIIPWVDAYSVWRGPTHVVVNEHPGFFDEFCRGLGGGRFLVGGHERGLCQRRLRLGILRHRHRHLHRLVRDRHRCLSRLKRSLRGLQRCSRFDL